MPVQSSSGSLIPANQQIPGSVRNAANTFIYSTGQSSDPQLWATNGAALQNVQAQIDKIWSTLQQSIPQPNPIQVVNSSGALVAVIGDFVDPTNNTGYEGIWTNNFYAGGTGPDTALFSVTETAVTIGEALNLSNAIITETGSDGSVLTITYAPQVEITGTDPSGDTLTIFPAQVVLQSTGTHNQYELELLKNLVALFDENNVSVVTITADTTFGAISANNESGTISVIIDTGGGSAYALSVNGADVNVNGNVNIGSGMTYKANGIPGVNAAFGFVTALGTSSTGVFGTPGAGQSNGPVVTSVTIATHTVSGGIIT